MSIHHLAPFFDFFAAFFGPGFGLSLRVYTPSRFWGVLFGITSLF
jgi:hypothetical protein